MDTRAGKPALEQVQGISQRPLFSCMGTSCKFFQTQLGKLSLDTRAIFYYNGSTHTSDITNTGRFNITPKLQTAR